MRNSSFFKKAPTARRMNKQTTSDQNSCADPGEGPDPFSKPKDLPITNSHSFNKKATALSPDSKERHPTRNRVPTLGVTQEVAPDNTGSSPREHQRRTQAWARKCTRASRATDEQASGMP